MINATIRPYVYDVYLCVHMILLNLEKYTSIMWLFI